MNLSKAAAHSLKTLGYFKCKAPSVPYRVWSLSALATACHNRLYLMGFIRGLNEGNSYKDDSGKVTSPHCHWVYALPCEDENIDGAVALIYMTGIREPVAFLVKGDSTVADEDFVDFTSDCSDKLGFYVMPVDKTILGSV